MIEIALLLALAASAAPGPAAAPVKTAAALEKAPKEKKVMEWKGQYGGPGQAGSQVVTDAKGWEALWRVLGKDAPALDLKTHAAAAVFVGDKPTGGWSVKFEEPKTKDGDVIVFYSVLAPKGFATQAFTAPYVVKAFPKPAKGKLLLRETAAE